MYKIQPTGKLKKAIEGFLEAFPEAEIYLEGRRDSLGVMIGSGEIGDTLKSPGVQYVKDPVLLSKSEKFAVIYFPGGTEWSARGETTYYRAEHELRKLHPWGAGDYILTRVQAGRQYRDCRRRLLEIAKLLDGEDG